MVAAECSTKCCVCSLLKMPNQFSTFKHELVLEQFHQLCQKETASRISLVSGGVDSRKPKKEELRVVVKRILIQLPTTAKTCPVEARNLTPSTADKDEELMTCTSCGICVHRCKLKL